MEKDTMSIVKLLDITIEHFKNVEFGHIAYASSKMARKHGEARGRDILGIYGQNGSGKTALMEAMMVWRQIMREQEPDEGLIELIQENTCLTLSFFIETKEERYFVIQTLNLCRKGEHVQAESQFFYRIWQGEKWSRKRTVRPARKNPDKQLLYMLKVYAANGVWIVTAKQYGFLNLNIGTAINFAYQEGGFLRQEQRVSLFEENRLDGEQLANVERMAEQLNLVLQSVVAGIQVSLKVCAIEKQEEGSDTEEEYLVTLQSQRYGKTFPLNNESGGIKRLLSMLSILIAAYNSPSLCVMVDEMDAGVFEYLLGEMLENMKNGAKGQFLFTSHNLRALEVLGNDHIIFSTANPKNRYLRFTRLRKNHNLRDEYLRCVLLGGQAESVYEDGGGYELGYAFRKAGKLYGKSQSSDTFSR